MSRLLGAGSAEHLFMRTVTGQARPSRGFVGEWRMSRFGMLMRACR